MFTKDVLKLFQEAAGRKATVAEVNAVQTYVLLIQLIAPWLHANPMNQIIQQTMMNSTVLVYSIQPENWAPTGH